MKHSKVENIWLGGRRERETRIKEMDEPKKPRPEREGK
jgi:hypothetical protein